MESVHQILRRWLAAEQVDTGAPSERAGRSSAAAERALGRLMLRLPDVRPRSGFAERVMAAADLRLAASTSYVAWPLRWPLQALVVLCLVLTGGAVASLPPLVELAAERISLAETVSVFARTVTVMVDYMAVLVAVGKLLAALYDAMILVLTAPPVAFGWLATIVFTTLTLRWLARLLSPLQERAPADRSSGYVAARG